MIGSVNKHIAFLLLRALEMQGEVEEAFGYAIIYKATDPQVFFRYDNQNCPVSFLILQQLLLR